MYFPVIAVRISGTTYGFRDGRTGIVGYNCVSNGNSCSGMLSGRISPGAVLLAACTTISGLTSRLPSDAYSLGIFRICS